MSFSTLTSRDTVELPSGTKLEYTLVKRGASENATQPTKLAICLHPWSWLGGRMTDPVLQLLTEILLEHGYEVLRYNSRGVGKSTGWPSFTGLCEAKDLEDLVQWARSIRPNISSLVIAGYSHGSLIASLHPVLADIQTSHILLSYPLGPRHWLTAFHGGQYTSALQDLVRNPRSNVLVIYGDIDNFTSVASYNAWAASLKAEPENASTTTAGEQSRGKLKVVEVAGGSHFWAEEDAVERLVDVVTGWLP